MTMVEQIGRYEVKAEIGHGGFGRVYSAFDPTVGRQVAVKTLQSDGDRELLVRFRNEAAAAGKLRHRNIVTIYDYGEHKGEPFIVMELLDGEDLQRTMQNRRPLTLLQKMQIMGQVAEGLEHAHVNGVVHRDVKPANMMLLPDFNVKIMDFGIAFVTQLSGTRLTKTGAVPGTLKYMAPEQFSGGVNDALSDIFSFGVSYYELLSGHHPFDGPTQPNVMFNIMQADPKPLREVYPECPESLDQVVSRCLSKERDLRYSTFDELLLDVKPIIVDLQQEQARTLVAQATRLLEGGQRDAAQATLREALELDPSNREGRRLRGQLQVSHKEAVRPKIEALVQTGRLQLDTRQFTNALNTFEAALKLDRSNHDVISLIAQARATQQQVAAAGKLLHEAARAFGQADLAGACQLLEQALAADPGHPEAVRLLGEVRSRIAQHEEDARAAQMEQDRKKAIYALLNESTQLLNSGDTAGAIQRLEALQQQAPDFPDVQQLLADAWERDTNRKKQETIARLIREVDQLTSARNFDRAIEMLELGLRYYPRHAAIEKRLSDTKAAQSKFVRDQQRQEKRQAPALVVPPPAADSGKRSLTKVAVISGGAVLAAAVLTLVLLPRDSKPVQQQKRAAVSAPVVEHGNAEGKTEPAPVLTPAAPPPAPVSANRGNPSVVPAPRDQLHAALQPVSPSATVTPGRVDVPVTPLPKVDPQASVALEWERLKDSKDVAQIDAFARANRSSPFAKSADDRVQDLRWEAVDKKNLAALRDYLAKYPNSPFAAASQDAISRLEWDAVDKNNLKALQDFRQRYPQGDLRTLATHEIERLEQKAQTERTVADDRAKTDQQKGDRDAVLQVIGRFTASIAQKDFAGMTAAYPGLPKDTWRQAFSRARSIAMTLSPLGEPQFSGSTAIVDCEQTTRTASGGQEVSSPVRKVRVSLAKKNAAWVILHIQ